MPTASPGFASSANRPQRRRKPAMEARRLRAMMSMRDAGSARKDAAAADKGMTDKDDALIVFTPSGRRGRFPIGTPVLQAARSLGVDIDSVCGGRAICGRCQITVGEGEFAKH